MAKYKEGNYTQLSRKLFNDETFKKLPYQSRWIYTVLAENEHRFTGVNEDFFFRSDKDLANDCGMPLRTLQKYKQFLIKRKIVKYWHMHFVDPKTNKKSERKVSAYKLLE